MASPNDYIAVFDSGVGGISVLRHLRRELPQEKFLYFGDSANAPYGTRPLEEIRSLTIAAADMLLRRDVKALVVACNTATSAAIAQLREKYPDKIIIGIEPALKLAADRFPGGTVGVMATPATLREAKFNRLMESCGSRCTTVKLPAPGLVELVEKGMADSEESFALLSKLLGDWTGKLDALVLGCTHYPFAAATLKEILPGTVLLDGGEGTARETKRRLILAGLLSEGPGEVVFENSARNEALIELCKKLLE